MDAVDFTKSVPWLDLPFGESLGSLDALVTSARTAGDQRAEASALAWLGQVQSAQGEPTAEDTLSLALDRARNAGDPAVICLAMLARAKHEADAGAHSVALAMSARAADLAGEAGISALVRQALFVSGTSLCHIGEHDLALESFEEARTLLRADADFLAPHERTVASGRYTAAQAQAWLMRGGLLREAGGAEAAGVAMQRARALAESACGQLVGSSPRFSHPALFSLVRVLLDAGECAAARDWLARVVDGRRAAPWRSLSRALALLAHVMICLKAGEGDRPDVASALIELVDAPHPRLKAGDLQLAALRCEFEAHEQCGRYAQALEVQQRWSVAKARLRIRLAREHGRWTSETLLMLREEASEFVTRELRAPLRQASHALDALASTRTVGVPGAALGRAAHSVRRALDIADQYLGVVRAEHLRPDELEELELGALVDDVCEQMAPPTDAEVRLVAHVERPILVKGDRVLLMRALGNLLSNAFKHAPPCSCVEVNVRRQADGRVRLSVADAGPGLPLDMRVRLFQRFATGSVRKGNGLGLAMVARAARVHQAGIEVDSGPGRGTTVSLLLAEAC